MLFAYLDPGSGSALLGTVFAIAGATLFSFKGLVYKLLRKEVNVGAKKDSRIVIFSEGKNYWGTWKGIVEELERRKLPFCYYTMDLQDPGLKTVSPFKYARLYNKEMTSSFVKLSKLEAKVCLSTTPNIGTPGYPIKRSKAIENLVYVYHATDPCASYRRGAFDNYDTMFMVGGFGARSIREIEKVRGLKEKKLVVTGLPYLDDLKERLEALPKVEKGERKVVLVAPSWGPICCLRNYGIGFVLDLAKAGYHVILRPHPQSYISEADLVGEWKAATKGNDNVEWDERVLPIDTMRIADVLVSDISSVRFDFAFLFARPVVTLLPPDGADAVNDEYEAADLTHDWMADVADRLGAVMKFGDAHLISDKVKTLADGIVNADLLKFRDETLANYGRVASAVVDEIEKLLK